MAENRKYKVIVSDRAKRMLGTHIRFMSQVSKEAEARAALWSEDNIAFDQRRRTMTNPEKIKHILLSEIEKMN